MSENSALEDPALRQRLPLAAVFGIKARPGLDWPRLWLLQHRELARLRVPRIAGHSAGALLAVVMFADDVPLPLLGLWLAFDDSIIRQQVLGSLPAELRPTDASSYNLTLSKIRNVASGALPASFVEPPIAAAAEHLQSLRQTSAMALTVVVVVLCLASTSFLRQTCASCAIENLLAVHVFVHGTMELVS